MLSEKGKKISIKTEVASSSMKPFKERPVEHTEEASQGKYEVISMILRQSMKKWVLKKKKVK